MNRICALLLMAVTASIMLAVGPKAGAVELFCHRTANEDVPENTLESLEQAALLGCNVVEIDLRRTLDGKIVLNHDGVLERLTDGAGDAESSLYGDLQLRDAGSWMGERFAGMHVALFEDALRLARTRDIRLILDIKTKGIGPEVLQLLEREGMLQRVRFGGEWDDIRNLDSRANEEKESWVQPGVTADQVKTYHADGKFVVANFSSNDHGMDLPSMKAAVAAGVDGINVDYPRLGADAVGRPVERRLHSLAVKADAGESSARVEAILELSRYRGFSLEEWFLRWLLDSDDHVSRAAALALATAQPRTPAKAFANALKSEHADTRANAAWALGVLHAPAAALIPLLNDRDPGVLQAALLALNNAPGSVNSDQLLSLLAAADPRVRGAAALALAHHLPDVAAHAIPVQLRAEIAAERKLFEDYQSRGKPQLTATEIATIMGYFRCQMKMVEAISAIPGPIAMRELEEQAFRPGQDFSQMNAVVAAFELWDRIGMDPSSAVASLRSDDVLVADRAEWMLVQGGPQVLPQVRAAIQSQSPVVRERAIRIVAWQGDRQSLELLHSLPETHPEAASLVQWAIAKIESLHPVS